MLKVTIKNAEGQEILSKEGKDLRNFSLRIANVKRWQNV